jgi:hypothetical protein
MLVGTDPHAERKVAADHPPHLPQDLEWKTQPIVRRAAIVIPAPVPARGEEVAQQIAVSELQDHRVQFPVTDAPGRDAERRADFLEFLGLRLLGGLTLVIIGEGRRSQERRFL